MSKISRRDFLKLTATLSAGAASYAFNPSSKRLLSQKANKPNIFILVLDAMSARNLSVYGYSRRTTPNLERFAQRATVYHSHYAGGNFTTPGACSILMGLYPWTHRAINLGGIAKRDLVNQNIFSQIGNAYYRVAYTQNIWADLLLRQFKQDIDQYISPTDFKYADESLNLFLGKSDFPDSLMTFYAFDSFLSAGGIKSFPLPGSPLLGYFDRLYIASRSSPKAPLSQYPYGLPSNGFYNFQVPTAMAAVSDLIQHLASQAAPVFGYFHLWAPHEPLSPRKKFVGIFPEEKIIDKPLHPLSIYHASLTDYIRLQDRYDAYIADVDAEFGRMLDALESAGVLANSYFILTSDHGQLFERGEEYHSTPLMYDPIIHVPLLISSPESKTHQDVFAPTSAVDLVPTLLHLAGSSIPNTTQGRLLPGFAGQADLSRTIFSVEAKDNSAFEALTQSSIALVKGNMKLIYYMGYKKYFDRFELYNLQDDINEMRNIYDTDTVAASQLKDELLASLNFANEPYLKN
jgi:arylsulfatase A-like enzyme